jgi:hypothetical protein
MLLLLVMTYLMDLFIQPLRKVLLTPLLRMHLVALRVRKSGLTKRNLNGNTNISSNYTTFVKNKLLSWRKER